MTKKQSPSEKAFEKKKAEKLAELEKENAQKNKPEGVPLRPQMQQKIQVDIDKLRKNHTGEILWNLQN